MGFMMYDVGYMYWLFAQLRAVLVLSHGMENIRSVVALRAVIGCSAAVKITVY
jgi:hypothetical protein